MHRRRTPLTSLILTTTILQTDTAAYLIGITLILILLGVVLPAVWSTKPTRRRAAVTVLMKILNAPEHDPRPIRTEIDHAHSVPLGTAVPQAQLPCRGDHRRPTPT